jgi:phosphate starvation-inducible protein PhoH and related proteins
MPEDNKRLLNLCGQYHANLNQIEKALEVTIHNRGNVFEISGNKENVRHAKKVLEKLFAETETTHLTSATIHLFLQGAKSEMVEKTSKKEEVITIEAGRLSVTPHSINQAKYVRNMFANDINFGIGPAGTGKTYLAVACAVNALRKELVNRLVLVRPVVEAGERLGFLPGDIAQKVDPYLRPLYDALYDMLGSREVEDLIAAKVIEIVPLAFMRGRTLNGSFVILDEGQNTTVEQMKMFLTRIGFGSKAVVTGDITQIDLERNRQSGLVHAMGILKKIKGISFSSFDAHDVVRHPLVQNIIRAYEKVKSKNSEA